MQPPPGSSDPGPSSESLWAHWFAAPSVVFFGRRWLMLLGIAWFSVGMFATAFATSVPAFGALRFATGLGLE